MLCLLNATHSRFAPGTIVIQVISGDSGTVNSITFIFQISQYTLLKLIDISIENPHPLTTNHFGGIPKQHQEGKWCLT